MSWLKVDSTLRLHPKLFVLAEKLNLAPAQAAGHLVFLWLWAMDYAKTGKLNGTPKQTAEAAGWPGDAGVFFESLHAAGFVDADSTIHGFDEWIAPLLEARKSEVQRVTEWKSRNLQGKLQGKLRGNLRRNLQGNLQGKLQVEGESERESERENEGVEGMKEGMKEAASPPPASLEAPDGARPVSQPAAMKDHRSDFRAPSFDQFHEEVTRAVIPLRKYFAGSPRLRAFASDKWNGQEVKGWEGCRDWRAFARQVASWYYANHEQLIARPGVEDLDYMDYVDACKKKNLAIQEDAARQHKAESDAFMSTPEGRAKAEKWQAVMRASMAETMDALGPAAQKRQEAEYAAKLAALQTA